MSLDRKVCEGHSVCVGLVPELFDVSDDDDRVMLVAGDEVPAGLETRVLSAVARCPKQVLSVAD
ncbi:ferredoxin [Planotetraspora sp. GP83]|uniref:ferredoxin n=1 Tax=Planotetraspora sp. GP83 TaxID=3156264 RepID=UPI003516160A